MIMMNDGSEMEWEKALASSSKLNTLLTSAPTTITTTTTLRETKMTLSVSMST